jgi:hypothetical protein
MKPQLLLGTALSIWALVKLPQEYWLHFAGLDFTDEQALHPWLLPSLALASVLVLIAAWRLRSHLPPRDRDPTFDVDAYIDRPPSAAVFPRREVSSIFSAALAEKVLLLAAVAVIFSQILDEIRASALQVALGVGVIVVLNSAVSLWRVKHGSRYGSTAIQFLAMATVNGGILAAGVLLRQTAGLPAYMPAQDAIFYLLLISLIITMYDRYRVIRDLSQDRRPRLRR